MFKLTEASLKRAIGHLCAYGDTDVFPHLTEIAFLRDEGETVVEELSKVDLDSYQPNDAVEALAPKSRLGFRIAHQQSLSDTILFLAALIEIGPDIEQMRKPSTSLRSFSYRFCEGSEERVFENSHTYKDWLQKQQTLLYSALKFKRVVKTDISDFYARINFHRIENLLDEAQGSEGANRFIKKVIRVVRAKQSFELPVGGAASRLLAELALVDTDNALDNRGFVAARFVDDFRLFLSAEQDPYEALSYLAQHLALSEGLSLNNAKTNTLAREMYLAELSALLTDIDEEVEGNALDVLTADLYFDDEPDPVEIEKLKAFNLLQILKEEVSGEDYDIGRVRVVFRALRITRPYDAVEYISDNLAELAVFSKEVVLLMQALNEEHPSAFDDLGSLVVDTILEPPASTIQSIRSWLLELMVRGIVTVNSADLRRIEGLDSIMDRRQLYLIRARHGDKSYFRGRKSSFGTLSPFEQTIFAYAACCLPKDEYDVWLSTIKPQMKGPLVGCYTKWLKDNRLMLLDKLGG